jgi:hypothetical protein
LRLSKANFTANSHSWRINIVNKNTFVKAFAGQPARKMRNSVNLAEIEPLEKSAIL